MEEKKKDNDGPSLETYIETRLNLIAEATREQARANVTALEALKTLLEGTQHAMDLRYQQRFEAQSDALAAAFLSQQTAMQTAFIVAEKAVQAALAAADRAVSKAELAADKRFESVNEFRQTLTDQQATFMPRSESDLAFRSMREKLDGLGKTVDAMVSEKLGIKGGWGYAIGLLGAIALIYGLIKAFAR